MADPFRKPLVGDPLPSQLATWAAMLDVAAAFQAGKFNRVGPRPDGAADVSSLVVRVRNDTSADLDAGAVVQVGPPVVSPVDFPGDVRRRPLFAAGVPTGPADDRVAVLQEPVPAGQVGRAVLAGLAVTRASGAGGYATPAAGQTGHLTGGASGPVRVLYRVGGSGPQTAVVVLSGAAAGGGGGTPPVASDLLWPARITAGPASGAYSWQRVSPATGADDALSTPSAGTSNAYPIGFMGAAWPLPAGTRGVVWAAGGGYVFAPFPEATETTPGAVNTGAQALKGDKTLRGDLSVLPETSGATHSLTVQGGPPASPGTQLPEMFSVYSSAASQDVAVGGGVGRASARGGNLGVAGTAAAARVSVWGEVFRSGAGGVFTWIGYPGTSSSASVAYAVKDVSGATTSTVTYSYGMSITAANVPGLTSSPSSAPVWQYLAKDGANVQLFQGRVDGRDGFAVDGRPGQDLDLTIAGVKYRWVKGIFVGVVPPPP